MPQQPWIPPQDDPEPPEPDQSIYIQRHIQRPWEALAEYPYSTEAAENLRLHEDELEARSASETSHGRGREPQWITERANAQRRYSTPDEGGRYHGKTPTVQRIITTG